MPIPVSARRFSSLYVLALACVTTLGGCSVLPWPDNQVSTTTPAKAEQAPEPENRQNGEVESELESGTRNGDERNSDTWSLKTLQALHDDRAEVLTLEKAWRLAVEHDPEFRAAVSDRAAARTEIRQGRAALLPQVQAGYTRNQITGMQRNIAVVPVREADLDYDSTSAYIQLQQPLFNLDRYAQFQRGKARAELGEAEFAVREYEAAMRLVTAWVDTVVAQGRVELSQALADSLREQAEAQEALFERNEGDRIDAQETRARLALATAELIAAEDAYAVARRRLQGLIGQEPPPVAGFERISNIDIDSTGITGDLLEWLKLAHAQGAMLRAAEARVQVAETEVSRASARYLPTADLVVAFVDADSENLDTLSQRSNTFQVGVNVAIPIFSGGYNTANFARSRHERQQAEHELVQAREQLGIEVARQYTAIQGGRQRIGALQAAVRAAEQSLDAARRGYEFGINSNLDVLRRQDNLFEARYELLETQARWLEARVALAAAVSEPVASVLRALDLLLQTV